MASDPWLSVRVKTWTIKKLIGSSESVWGRGRSLELSFFLASPYMGGPFWEEPDPETKAYVGAIYLWMWSQEGARREQGARSRGCHRVGHGRWWLALQSRRAVWEAQVSCLSQPPPQLSFFGEPTFPHFRVAHVERPLLLAGIPCRSQGRWRAIGTVTLRSWWKPAVSCAAWAGVAGMWSNAQKGPFALPCDKASSPWTVGVPRGDSPVSAQKVGLLRDPDGPRQAAAAKTRQTGWHSAAELYCSRFWRPRSEVRVLACPGSGEGCELPTSCTLTWRGRKQRGEAGSLSGLVKAPVHSWELHAWRHPVLVASQSPHPMLPHWGRSQRMDSGAGHRQAVCGTDQRIGFALHGLRFWCQV